MTDLWWPGDERAGDVLTEGALLDALIEVEQAWLSALAALDLAPRADLRGAVTAADLPQIAETAEDTGNPVVGLVKLLRERSDNTWVHRGLTSQDVLDTALMLCLRRARARIVLELDSQVQALVGLIQAHRSTVMAGRTLTQYAVPTTFARKAAEWLSGVLDARGTLAALRFPAQLGGAAGTFSAVTMIAASSEAAFVLAHDAAGRLGLDAAAPWHTSRRPITAIGDALVLVNDACGRIAADVVTLSRPEIAELSEPAGRGGSSTMPHKRNPVLSVLIRRAALSAPQWGATLHLAAGLANDERPDGAWHAEWSALRDLGRRTVVAASQTAEVLGGLIVHEATMADRVQSAWADLTAERDSLTALAHPSADDQQYLGAADVFVQAVLGRVSEEETP